MVWGREGRCPGGSYSYSLERQAQRTITSFIIHYTTWQPARGFGATMAMWIHPPTCRQLPDSPAIPEESDQSTCTTWRITSPVEAESSQDRWSGRQARTIWVLVTSEPICITCVAAGPRGS